ncbi:aminomethyl transferase family protein [Novosphingobium flavum]|uniref:Aminomethyl transferase family protein n=1 Tax=Novosphingobium aerophilum TaxID=2839843 RepID=A0A7X1KBV1_9SPHN|nr:aminomethyl transferase family protein [Novosphingobium aerophilum]MBC2651634.1 aminomethyl transferase family protein [Novosphingobium aerophilum]MBC2661454.1 aminomethyl transferase family protein [Novosphingobium aerophilum]
MTASLELKLNAQTSIVDFLRNQQVGPNVYPGVPAEYTNWRDEQRAWAETAILFNQSFHMVDLLVTGPGAFDMLAWLAPNSFKGFVPDRAKQFAPVTPEGYVIGDVILFYLAENTFELVGRAPTIEWVEYWASTGRWDVRVERDERTAARPLDQQGHRRNYRFQLQGPNAMAVLERAMGQTPPDLKFFHMTTVAIAGAQVRALRHGMAGQPGYELFGPWADYHMVRDALIAAGQDFGLRLSGGRTYSSNTLESGWIPSPLPAVYTGDGTRAFREWLPANAYAGMCSIGGSFVSDRIEDYYLTPWDLGYGHMVKFDHDFVGREALEAMKDRPHRRKVTLALDNADIVRVMSSMLQTGDKAKFLEFPSAVYAMHPYDAVLQDGRTVGLSTWIGYTVNAGRFLALAMVDESVAEPGTEVSLLWGEPDGGTSKPTVERHVQTEIKAVVSPVPYSEVARDSYADGWRTKRG